MNGSLIYKHDNWRCWEEQKTALFFIIMAVLMIVFAAWALTDPSALTYFCAAALTLGAFANGILGLEHLTHREHHELTPELCRKTIGPLSRLFHTEATIGHLDSIQVVGKGGISSIHYRVRIIGKDDFVEVGPFRTRPKATEWARLAADYFDFIFVEQTGFQDGEFTEPLPAHSRIEYSYRSGEALLRFPLAEGRRLYFQIQVINGLYWTLLSIAAIVKFGFLGEASGPTEMWMFLLSSPLVGLIAGYSTYCGLQTLSRPMSVQISQGALSCGPSEGFMSNRTRQFSAEEMRSYEVSAVFEAGSTAGQVRLHDLKTKWDIYLAVDYQEEDVKWLQRALEHHLSLDIKKRRNF